MLHHQWTRYFLMTFYIGVAILSLIAVTLCHDKSRANVGAFTSDQLFQKFDKLAADDHVRSRRHCTHSARERRNADRMAHVVTRSTGTRGSSDFGSALYFTGQSDYIRLAVKNHLPNSIDYPTEEITVELWVKPEGGQRSPAIIIGFRDTCHPNEREMGWSLGINGGNNDRNARFFFSLHTDRSRQASTITSHRLYEPNTWVHLTATYNGHRMKLYVNGAVVGSSLGQSGPIFNAATQQCKELVLGGSLQQQATYRGAIDELKIWPQALGHEAVRNNMFNDRARNSGHLSDIIHEDFNFIGAWEDNEKWEDIGDRAPFSVDSDIPNERHNMKLAVPPCGVTICDNPTVMMSYMERPVLRRRKVLRYRVVSIANDDGSMPTVTQEQIARHHREINDAFAPYNISWDVSDIVVRNTSMRRRVVLHSCHASNIGNDNCDHECESPYTGSDGGDCKPDGEEDSVCEDSKHGDGTCDEECNKHYHQYDDGDCCNPLAPNINKTCFDPQSPFRSYMTVEELKHIINAESKTRLNIFFVNFDDPSIEGFATMPWETDALGVLGGSVLSTNCCKEPGSADSIIHEIGHNLGLWHVHEGVSDLDCSDPCYERQSSLELGDMIGDTNPTPENMECRDPQPCDNYATCGFEDEEYVNTPFSNYMSYADHDCTDHFTPQQSARMHCYIDLFYSTWRSDNSTLNSIPLPPHVLSETFSEHTDNSVTLTWLPLDDVAGEHGVRSGSFGCGDCTEGNILTQYASEAEMIHGSKVYRQYAPDRATGAPDAPRCTPSPRFSWMACSDCVLELRFTTPVIPDRLSVWVNYQHLRGANYGIKNIELITTYGNIVSLGPKEVYCDMPFTTILPHMQEQVDKVIIYATQFLGIDAVLLESKPHHTDCISCSHRSYSVRRDPGFGDHGEIMSIDVKKPYFLDRSVRPGVNYTYSVVAVLCGNKESGPSPPLHFRLGKPFCGNGVIDSDVGEECDDGNAMDGDGCNTECVVETHFKCIGEPSLCYRFFGDGICENFERNISTEDCGYYTPRGYEDQWAIGAIANPDYQSRNCPTSVVVGDPGPYQICHKSIIDSIHMNYNIKNHAWYPCNVDMEEEPRTDYWLRVQFQDAVVATAVIIHLGSDGLGLYQEPKRVSISLIGSDRTNHAQAAKNVAVSCRDNPVHFNILHDLSKPFYYTKEVYIEINSHDVSISAVRLRSWKAFDPVEIHHCGHNQIYIPEPNLCQARKPKCSKFKLKNATINCTGTIEGEKVAEGGQCEATCNTGYTPKETSVFECVGGEWRGPDLKRVKCRSIDCGQKGQWPVIPYAKVNCPDGTKYNRECTFKCQSPAKLQGSSTSNSVVCQDDGLFSLPNSFCQMTCNSLPVVTNAVLQNNNCAQTSTRIVGTTCKYRCNEGYQVDGKSHSKHTLRYTCGADGTWSGPRCVPVVCPKPPLIFHGSYNCTDSFNFNSVCTLHCPMPNAQDSTENLITCRDDGTWDRSFQTCSSFVGECVPPSFPDPDVLHECGTNEISSTCTVSCKTSQFSERQVVINSSNDIIYATSMREWENTIVCTGQRKWFPDPLQLTCVDKCDDIFLDDDMCDEANNKAYCDWDNGRCCNSTCPECAGTIQPFPSSCTANCACLDPDAAENI